MPLLSSVFLPRRQIGLEFGMGGQMEQPWSLLA
jgi:hypothetical protein